MKMRLKQQTNKKNLDVVMRHSPGEEISSFLELLTKTLGSLGFKQTLPPPLEKKSTFFSHPELKRRFAPALLNVFKSDRPAVRLAARQGEAGDDSLVLSPTHLPAIFKQYLAHTAEFVDPPVKQFYLSPVVSLNDDLIKVQHELGILILGQSSVTAYAELLIALSHFLTELGMTGFVFEINNLGCQNCQKTYQEVFQDHLRQGFSNLCANCLELMEENPWLAGRCANAACEELIYSGPEIVDFLDDSCRKVLIGVLEALDEMTIPYSLNSRFFGSGLNSEHLVFRVSLENNPEEIFGLGGDFSTLGKHWGEENRMLSALGFVAGLEKFLPYLRTEQLKPPIPAEVFMVSLGEIASRKVLSLYREFLRSGISAQEAMLLGNGLKSQLQAASDAGSPIALIIGQKEAVDETVILRDMRSGMQELFSRDRIIEEVMKRLGR